MMTEISAELDSETATEPNAKAGVKALLEAFASQLEVLERIRDQIHALCCAGHYTCVSLRYFDYLCRFFRLRNVA